MSVPVPVPILVKTMDALVYLIALEIQLITYKPMLMMAHEDACYNAPMVLGLTTSQEFAFTTL